jgi:hypothetical protein
MGNQVRLSWVSYFGQQQYLALGGNAWATNNSGSDITGDWDNVEYMTNFSVRGLTGSELLFLEERTLTAMRSSNNVDCNHRQYMVRA